MGSNKMQAKKLAVLGFLLIAVIAHAQENKPSPVKTPLTRQQTERLTRGQVRKLTKEQVAELERKGWLADWQIGELEKEQKLAEYRYSIEASEKKLKILEKELHSIWEYDRKMELAHCIEIPILEMCSEVQVIGGVEIPTYHLTDLQEFAAGKTRIHVRLQGFIRHKSEELDGDLHIRLCDSNDVVAMDLKHCVVARVIPEAPIPIPSLGTFVEVDGISRRDRSHDWWEVHPVRAIRILPAKPKD